MLSFGCQHHSHLFELYLLLHSTFLCYSLFSSDIDQVFFASSLFLSFKMKKMVIVYLLLYIRVLLRKMLGTGYGLAGTRFL